jgi:hypothetical protein
MYQEVLLEQEELTQCLEPSPPQAAAAVQTEIMVEWRCLADPVAAVVVQLQLMQQPQEEQPRQQDREIPEVMEQLLMPV